MILIRRIKALQKKNSISPSPTIDRHGLTIL